MVQRTRTMEIRALRESMAESPPPPPSSAGMREWFAGLALSNAELMRDVPPEGRVAEAVRLADELVAALSTARVPTEGSMGAPGAAEMQQWDEAIAARKAPQAQTVAPPRRRRNSVPPRNSMPPSPNLAAATRYFRTATGSLRRASQRAPALTTPVTSSRYSLTGDEQLDD